MHFLDEMGFFSQPQIFMLIFDTIKDNNAMFFICFLLVVYWDAWKHLIALAFKMGYKASDIIKLHVVILEAENLDTNIYQYIPFDWLRLSDFLSLLLVGRATKCICRRAYMRPSAAKYLNKQP